MSYASFQIYRTMSSKVLCAVFLLACALKCSLAQRSCKGECGAEYYRGYMCQCDYTCLSYGECCQDYESQCTTKNSCMGRCGESFKRGRRCSCDSDCVKYNQCCPDFKTHCDADEIRRAASETTAPRKTSSCDNVNDSKHKEPTLTEATEQTPFNEDNSAAADDYSDPLDSPTSYPPDDSSDDVYSTVPSSDYFSKNGVEDLEVSPVPESSSRNGPSTNDPLDQVTIEPTLATDTLEFTTEKVFSQTKGTPSENDLPILNPTTGDATTESTDAGDLKIPPEEVTSLDDIEITVDLDSSQLISTSVSPMEPTASTPDIEATTPLSDEQEVTTINTQDSNTVLETSQVTTVPTSSTLASNPEETTSNPNTEDITSDPPFLLKEPEDPTTPISPGGAGNLSELDEITTHIPPSTAAVQDDTTKNVTPEVTTADALKVTMEPTSPPDSGPASKPQGKPDPHKLKPTPKPDTKPLDTQTLNLDNTRDYQADDSNDTNLCSGRPVSAVTTLRNGTMVVFRGHYFWFLDRHSVPSPAQGITQVWGVPSPIDTVFTRCNCQGKTYILKGGRYWRFENDALDPGYPKVTKLGFDGLQGHITAALSVPQYKTRRESVYFFKRGGFVQKYSYQFGTSSTCGKKVHNPIYAVHTRMARQAVSVLGPAINIRTMWRGFPSTITAAASVPSSREPEGYKYYVFSRSTALNVRIDGKRPVIAAPKANVSPQTNKLFQCPKKS
ncbi:proteoglycan 4b isoform 2-T2 [Odontesthes bonariensis]|uniref:proteoglycan 4b isoform X2 n=1 Tax=Odontesthes bonariensis TaxID=219752 RepID=UPI003F584B1D